MIKENIKQIMEIIGPVNIVAVSKKKSVEKIKQAIKSGVNIIGENKIQEAYNKYNQLKNYFEENNIKFHFIGHLQSNKVKKAVEMFDLIQTVDSIKLTDEINKRAKEIDKVQDILVQVNIGKEPQKFGIIPENTLDFLGKIKQFKNINVKGLMCIHPRGEDSKPYFKEMKKIFDMTNLEILSMGMSSDFQIAIDEGSNMIRIGTKIFGERE
jgi:PLP dependent protein